MPAKPKVLILGGTEFVGRQLVESLLAMGGYDIYLFNRGKTNVGLFPGVSRIIGDRETDDIQQIGQHKWTYVVDFSSYFPHSLQKTLDYINRDVKQYIYVSTISVYALQEYDGSFAIQEDFQQKEYASEQLTEPSLKFYGEKKVACEDVLAAATWLPTVILRPGVIYGRYDPTHRLYSWIARIKNRRSIVLPDGGKHRISITYAEDMVNVIQQCLDGKVYSGTFNCVSGEPFTFRSLLEEIRQQLGAECSFVTAPRMALREAKASGKDFPFYWGMDITIDNTKLIDVFQPDFIPLRESIGRTIGHYAAEGWPVPKVGMSAEAEDALIAELNKKK